MKNIFSTIHGPALDPDFGPGFGSVNDRPYLFVIISVVIHALVLLMLTNLPRGPIELLSEKNKPLDIEIVQLPDNIPLMGEAKTPKKITAYAQRSQTVKKEEYPMQTGRGTALIPPSQAGKQSIILIKPKGEGGGGREGVSSVKSAKASVPDKALKDGDGAIRLEPAPVPEKRETARPVRPGPPGEKGAQGEVREGLSLIPSETTLHQIARQEENAGVESPKEGSGMTLLLNTSDFRFQKYFIAVKRRIEFFWEYPQLAARRGQQGRLKIDFTIQKDGSIKDGGIDIIKSSNYPILDDAATTALRLASPFNPFPEGFEHEEITVHGSFEYNLYRGR